MLYILPVRMLNPEFDFVSVHVGDSEDESDASESEEKSSSESETEKSSDESSEISSEEEKVTVTHLCSTQTS